MSGSGGMGLPFDDPAELAAAKQRHVTIQARIPEVLGAGDILCLTGSAALAPPTAKDSEAAVASISALLKATLRHD